MPDEMFDEGVQALKAGQRVRAKELLTRLIKVDQSKPDYWLWMSAAVDSEKEQVFCLQNVLKLDPNLVAARRGQVVLGALRPEAAGLPPTNFLEDTRVAIPSIAPGAGLGAILADRRGRETLMVGEVGAVAFVAVVVACLSVVAPGWFRPQRFVVGASTPADTQQARPSATVTVAAAAACKLPANPGPATRLAAYLCLTQPPTSLAAATEASVSENYTRLKKYYHDSDWTNILSHAHGLLADPNVPQSAHVYFYVAEAYRHTGDLTNALKYYQAAARKDTNFVPAFWGRAPDEVTQNKRQAALADFDHAILADSSFGASYLDRTSYYSISGNPAGAMNDRKQAQRAAPHNALVLASLALAFLDHGQAALGLDQAKSALSHDPVLALGYFARGRSEYAQATYRSADQDLSLSYRYVLASESPLPAQYQANVLYAPALAKAADNDETSALALLSQAVEPDNSNVSLCLAGGGLYMLAGRYDDTRGDSGAAVGQLAKTAPKNPRLVAPTWDWAGPGWRSTAPTTP
jgi:tetratricopeptide (TPR) repeat protein